MRFIDSAVKGRDAGSIGKQNRGRSSLRRVGHWQSGVSLLGLAVAGATLLAGPARADELDLGGNVVRRIDFDKTPGVPYTIVENGTLQLANVSALTFNGVLRDNSGVGGIFSLQKFGTGNLTLNGANTYFGSTSLNAGTLQVGNSNALGTGNLKALANTTLQAGAGGLTTANNITFQGLFTVDVNVNTYTLAGTLQDFGVAGTLRKTSGGTLTLAGSNSYTGGTQVKAGTLEVSTSSALGTGQLTVSNAYLAAVADGLSFSNAMTFTNAAINTNAFNLSLTGNIGAGNFTKIGAGILTLSGNNDLSGGITVVNGGLAVGSNTALGTNSLGLYGGTSLIAATDGIVLANAVVVASGPPITFGTRTSTLTLNGDLTYLNANVVTLNKTGTGTLIVNGHWFGSASNVNNVVAGNLQVNGTVATGLLKVASGATLSGSGSVVLPGGGATVTIAAGGNLSPGTTAPGTLNIDNLVLKAGSQLNFKLGQAGSAGGARNDLVIVNSNLTLAGTLNVANGPFFTAGNYTLFTYGSHSGNGLTLGTLPPGYGGSVAVVAGTGTTGSVILTASGSGRQYWDGSGALADHVVSGGSGSWNANSFNWASANGNLNSVWNNQQAVFGTIGGTVNVAGPQQFTLLQFDVDSYHLSGDGLTAVSPGSSVAPEIRTVAATTTTIDNLVSGTGGLLKSGLGTLVLNGANTFTGTVGISAGRVNIGNAAALGGGAVELSDATTLGAGAALALASNLALDNRATVDSNGFGLTLNGVVSGPGSLTIADTGTTVLAGLVTLAGVNTYLGGTTISNARALVAADSALGDAGGGLALNGGSLLTTASFSAARAVTLSGDSSFAPASGTTLTLSGVIGGPARCASRGPGRSSSAVATSIPAARSSTRAFCRSAATPTSARAVAGSPCSARRCN